MHHSEQRGPKTAIPPTRRTRLGRFGAIMFVGQLSWASLGAAASPLLAVFIAGMDAPRKVEDLALVTTVGAVGAVISMIVSGFLSDHTRSRWGRRIPWILGGSLLASITFAAMSLAPSLAVLVLTHLGYQVGINMMLGALNAIPADYLADTALGKASAAGGAGYLVAQVLGSAVGAAFVAHPRQGFMTVAWLVLAGGVAVALLLPAAAPTDGGTEEPKRERPSWKTLAPPRDAQFWWVFVGRFLFVIALFMTMQFQTYIATDKMKLATVDAGRLQALNTVLFAATAAVASIVTGPWSDHIGRRKPFVIGAPLLCAAGLLPLLMVSRTWALTTFALVAGLSFGSYISVDGALMVEVLPNRDNSARDLGFLSAANSLPMVLAPGAGALLVHVSGYPAVFSTGIALALLGALAITRVTRTR